MKDIKLADKFLMAAIGDNKDPFMFNLAIFYSQRKIVTTNKKIMTLIEFDEPLHKEWPSEFNNETYNFIDLKKYKTVDIPAVEMGHGKKLNLNTIYNRLEEAETFTVKNRVDIIFQLAKKDIKIDYFRKDVKKIFENLPDTDLTIAYTREVVSIKFKLTKCEVEVLLVPLTL
jgi:hypothetical protein